MLSEKKLLITKKQFSRQKRPSKRQKVRTRYLWKLFKKKISEQLLEAFLKKFFFFLKKTFYFWLAAGLRYATLQPSASVPLHSALPPTKNKNFFQKKKNFLRTSSKSCSEILFFENFQRSLVFFSIIFCHFWFFAPKNIGRYTPPQCYRRLTNLSVH